MDPARLPAGIAAWVGGSLFYLLVLRPALRRSRIVSGGLTCASCDEVYPIEDSIPNLLPPHLRDS